MKYAINNKIYHLGMAILKNLQDAIAHALVPIGLIIT